MDALLCYQFSKSQWQALSPKLDAGDESAWQTAIDVFEKRINERFLSCIEALDRAGTAFGSVEVDRCVPGFSIMAICCLLVESLQGFREKPPAGETEATYISQKFLQLPAFGGAFDEGAAHQFLTGIRNGILHEAETRKWVIRKNRPANRIVAPLQDGYELNRTLFCAALKTEFERYLGELRNSGNRRTPRPLQEKDERYLQRGLILEDR
jgi:hypothetical protein